MTDTMNVLDYFYSRCGNLLAPAGRMPSTWLAGVEPALRAISIDSPVGKDCMAAIDGVELVISTLGLKDTARGNSLVRELSDAVAVMVLG